MRLLLAKRRDDSACRLPSSFGIVPVRALLATAKVVRYGAFDRDAGMVPAERGFEQISLCTHNVIFRESPKMCSRMLDHLAGGCC